MGDKGQTGLRGEPGEAAGPNDPNCLTSVPSPCDSKSFAYLKDFRGK
jgi:hypothetical protein